MMKALRDRGGGDAARLIRAARAAREAGFALLEPVLAEEGALSPAAGESAVRRIGEKVRGAGIGIASAAGPRPAGCCLSCADRQAQEASRQIVLSALDRAAWLGASVLAIEAGRCPPADEDGAPRVRYADALDTLHEALRGLSFEAEARAVVLAVGPAGDRFLLSPVEMRELVDRVGSPWVQASLNVPGVARHGWPADWIETLGARIVHVVAGNLRAKETVWAGVAAVLRGQGYAGPIVCTGPGSPRTLGRRLDESL